jgi:uncharacterized membrane protein (UPF0127 family)
VHTAIDLCVLPLIILIYSGVVLLYAPWYVPLHAFFSSKKKQRHTAQAILSTTLLLFSTLSPPLYAQISPFPQSGLPKTKLSAGIHIIQAEVARTKEARQHGLMHRRRLGSNHGMLFAFDTLDRQCFWMRNTPLPLSIAFIADDGAIVNIEDMTPETDDRHCSRRPVRYALEMTQGWFKEHGIQVRQKIEGLP